MTPALVAQERGKQVADLLADPLLVAWIAVVTLAPVAVGGMVAFARSLQYDQSELRASSKAGSSAQGATLKQERDALAKQVSALAAKLSALEAGMSAQAASIEQAQAALAEEVSVLWSDRDLHQASTEQAEASFACSYCGDEFASKQARSAHEAWCEQNPNSRRAQPSNNGSLERNAAK
jgi:hypothetical protein